MINLQKNLPQLYRGLLSKKPFRGNIYKLIDNAYPGRFDQREFIRNRKIIQF